MKTKDLQEKFDEILAKKLEELPQIVDHTLKCCVMSMLGISVDGQGRASYWSHDDSRISRFIKDRIKDSLEEFVGPLVDKELKRLMKLKSLPRSIADDCERRFSYELGDKVRDVVMNKGEEAGKRIAAVIETKIEKQIEDEVENIKKANGELFNQENFESKVGKIMLDSAAKEILKLK